MRKPRLIAVSGPPGSGKSTLARALAAELGCPAILRDEVKQGMAATLGPAATDTDALNVPVMKAFFDTLGVLLRAQVTVVAEAAYQDRLWQPGLQPLADIADLWVIRCHTPTRTLTDRIRERATLDPHRTAHADEQLLTDIATGAYDPEAFAEISLDAHVLRVDTSAGYRPTLAEITAHVQAA
ncbi:AAA family ATPase [Streptomyces sp. NPDC004311]|uniref:AAA family ATPase n=1 Tax=Streptomyces sp. NPDC004311 TaxID=3364698 RepID=UPI0036CE5FB2